MKKFEEQERLMDKLPIYVKKIDFIYAYLHAQKTLSDTILHKLLPYIPYAVLILVGLGMVEIRELKQNIQKAEIKLDYSLSVFEMYRANIELVNGTSCFKCHSDPSMIMSKMVLHYDNFESFLAYVRAGGKSRNGMIMPAIKKKDVPDEQLREIYEKAKKW